MVDFTQRLEEARRQRAPRPSLEIAVQAVGEVQVPAAVPVPTPETVVPLVVEDHATITVEEPQEPPQAQEPAAAPRALVLDPLQQQAIDACGTEPYTNISGTAGVGKTLVAKEIIKTHPGTVLAATTGIASVNLGEGTTINALLRYFDTKDLTDKYTTGILQGILRRLRRSGVRRILIDEKSMLAGQQLTPIARAVREVNEGGIYALDDQYQGVGENDDDDDPLPTQEKDLPPLGLTLVGDFGQLPPVPDTQEVRLPDGTTKLQKIPIQYAFESPEWQPFGDHTTTLTTIFRQEAREFVNALHAVRRGDVASALNFFTADRFTAAQDDTFNGTTIFAKNDAVDRYNALRLDQVTGARLEFTATRNGKQRGDWKQIPDVLRLKEGALVMILANARKDDGDENGPGLLYANGDLGILKGRNETGFGWVVTLQRTGQDVTVLPVRRENTIPLEPGRKKELQAEGRAQTAITERGKGKSEIVGSVIYMPLRAAYGCTTHKTQGLSLDHVQINLHDPFFRMPGMLFVALSRARTAEGLTIVGSQRGFVERCTVEPRVQPWL